MMNSSMVNKQIGRWQTIIMVVLAIMMSTSLQAFSQDHMENVDFFLLTCSPSSEVYAQWGHSALRVVNHETGSDVVCNWGVFDFSTKHFAWKFAKGRLNYMLSLGSYQGFINSYAEENRWVQSQKINLNDEEKRRLMTLISDNLKPENVNYRYDFFFDNCATRIRDILEKTIGDKLLYPPIDPFEPMTFREHVDSYLLSSKWLNFGIDLLMGSSADKKVSMRDRMFLPLLLRDGLSELDVNRDGKMIPLLTNPTIVVNAPPQTATLELFDKTSPTVIFSVFLIIVILLSALLRGVSANNVLDLFIYFIFSILAGMMIFFNFFTDHIQMRMNYNIIWLSPFIILCLLAVVFNRKWTGCFKITFYLCLLFFFALVLFHNFFNGAFLPLTLILILRSSVRAGFEWNPLSLPTI